MIERLSVSDQVRKEVVDSLRAARSAQGKARKEFAELRNATIAHRDPDAILQYEAIASLKIEDVFTIAAEFYAAARRFIDILPLAIAESGTMPALIAQWIRSNGAQYDKQA